MSWPLVELGNLAEFINGFAFKPKDWQESGKKIIRIQNLTNPHKEYNLTELDVPNKYNVTKGDILVSWSATLDVFEWSKEDALLNQHIFKVVPDYEKVDKRYFKYALKKAIDSMLKFSRGSTMKHVNRGDFLGTKIPLPPLDEQKRIAAILDKADAIRRKRQQAINLADDFLRSVFLDMFGDPVTNPKGWDVKKVKNFAKVTTGNTPSRKESKYYGEDIEWIKSDNINTPEHILTTATEFLSFEGEKVARTVEKGSTLITCIAGSFDCIGNVAFADRKVSFNQQINALTPKRELVSDWFLYSLILFSKKLIQNASTNSMKGMVSKGKLEEVELILPPLEKQKEFEMIFNKQIKLKQKMSQSYLGSSDKFNSLSQKAFSGDL